MKVTDQTCLSQGMHRGQSVRETRPEAEKQVGKVWQRVKAALFAIMRNGDPDVWDHSWDGFHPQSREGEAATVAGCKQTHEH